MQCDRILLILVDLGSNISKLFLLINLKFIRTNRFSFDYPLVRVLVPSFLDFFWVDCKILKF